MNSLLAFVSEGWTGQAKLWKAFWVGYVLGLFYGLVVVGLIKTFLMASGHPASPATTAVLSAPWLGWWSVATWRCAFNCRWSGWGYLALTVVLSTVATAISRLFGTSSPWIG